MTIPLPNIPTDNLYKFKSVTFLLFTIFFFFGFVYMIVEFTRTRANDKIQNTILDQEYSLDSAISVSDEGLIDLQLGHQHNLTDTTLKKLLRILNEFQESKYTSQAVSESIDEIRTNFSLAEINKTIDKEIALANKWKEIVNARLKSQKFYLDKKRVLDNNETLNEFLILGSILCFLLFWVFLYLSQKSFQDWYNKYQVYQDDQIKKVKAIES